MNLSACPGYYYCDSSQFLFESRKPIKSSGRWIYLKCPNDRLVVIIRVSPRATGERERKKEARSQSERACYDRVLVNVREPHKKPGTCVYFHRAKRQLTDAIPFAPVSFYLFFSHSAQNHFPDFFYIFLYYFFFFLYFDRVITFSCRRISLLLYTFF